MWSSFPVIPKLRVFTGSLGCNGHLVAKEAWRLSRFEDHETPIISAVVYLVLVLVDCFYRDWDRPWSLTIRSASFPAPSTVCGERWTTSCGEGSSSSQRPRVRYQKQGALPETSSDEMSR